MPLTTAFRHATINHFLRNASQSPKQSYLSLSSTTPSVDGSGVTELVGLNRELLTFNAPTGGGTANAAEITFTNTSGGTWNVAAICIFDASVGGTLQAFAGGLSSSVPNGEIFVVFATDLTFTLS